MEHYSPLGIEKIERQAAAERIIIRCPRDGVVMRVVAWRARRRDGSGETRRGAGRPPSSSKEWAVIQLDVECPACRRSAAGIEVPPRPAKIAQPA
jgi:ssDNA-binding Zn-finger/Zn-ribbon topoisomerase 1